MKCPLYVGKLTLSFMQSFLYYSKKSRFMGTKTFDLDIFKANLGLVLSMWVVRVMIIFVMFCVTADKVIFI